MWRPDYEYCAFIISADPRKDTHATLIPVVEEVTEDIISLAGGSGKIETTIYGVFILAIIGNMINLQGNVNSWWQQIITGLLLIIVLVLQVIPAWQKNRA